MISSGFLQPLKSDQSSLTLLSNSPKCRSLSFFNTCHEFGHVWSHGLVSFVSSTGLIIPANCVSALINKLSTSDQCQQLAVQEQQKRQQLHPQSLSHAPNTQLEADQRASRAQITSPPSRSDGNLSISALQAPGPLPSTSPPVFVTHPHVSPGTRLRGSAVSHQAVMILRRKASVVQRKDFRVLFLFRFFFFSSPVFTQRDLTGDVSSSDIQSEKICDVSIETESKNPPRRRRELSTPHLTLKRVQPRRPGMKQRLFNLVQTKGG